MRKVLVGILAAAAMWPAGQAAADGSGTFSVCAPGAGSSFYACASAYVGYVDVAGTGGTIILRVTNQGLLSGGVYSDNLGYAITGIGITYPPISNPSGMSVSNSAGTTVVGTPADEWQLVTSFAGFSVEAGAANQTGVNGGIWNCAGPGAAGSYYKTCGTDYVQFSFHTDSENWFNPADMQVSFAMRGQSGETVGRSYRCADDPTVAGGVPNGSGGCGWGGTNDNTVPEPVSLVLLGSGLLGLAGVRNWRRRNS